MESFLTLGRVASFAGKPEPGGYKIYLTDGRSQWVELGGGGAVGNPHGLLRQRQRGLDTAENAWDFAHEFLISHPEVSRNPLKFHRLYSYAASGELYFDRSVSITTFLSRRRQGTLEAENRALVEGKTAT